VPVLVLDAQSSDAQLAELAGVLIGVLAATFTQLEMVWRSEERRQELCGLPRSVVVKVLGSDDLVVRSENTVLVAALSWLRTAGKDTALEERREVLHAVRLLQLSPWFLSWLVFYAPEGAELLPVKAKAQAMQYPASGRLLPEQLLPQPTWATPRKGAAPSMKVDISISVTQSAFAAMVEGKPSAMLYGEPVHYNGLAWRAVFQVWSSAGDAFMAVGAQVSLHIGGADVPFTRDLLCWSIHLSAGVQSRGLCSAPSSAARPASLV
jgi:hypothetical protein